MNYLKMGVFMEGIELTEDREDIERCFPVMKQLRPHLLEKEFVNRVEHQQKQGYQLARLELDGLVKAVAGFRISESLGHGKFMYVDDLVTDSSQRSRGYGDSLFDWLVAFAKAAECEELRLDCAVHRFDAHRFYLRKRMNLTTHHLILNLSEKVED